MTQAEPLLFAVIVNWNNAADTVECVRSLFNVQYSRYAIVVVDNCSPKNDVEILQAEFGSRITILKSGTNIGFSGGNNLGIAYAMEHGAEYVLLINNDTTVEPDFLRPLVAAFDNNERCGLAVPKICFYSRPATIWTAGGFLSRIRASGFSRGEGRSASEYCETEDVTFASGCCMLVSRDAIRTVGMWDESYFLYVEDVDYSSRMLLHGYRIIYEGASVMYHKVNTSTKKIHSALPLYYTARNRFFYNASSTGCVRYAASVYLWTVYWTKFTAWKLRGDTDKVNAYRQARIDFRSGRRGCTLFSTNDFGKSDNENRD